MARRVIALTSPQHRQAPFAEFDVVLQRWKIWIHFNNAATAGTYIVLEPNGAAEQFTIGPDGNVAHSVTLLQEL